MKNLKYFLLFVLSAAHFYVLHRYGIATFLTTVLFYLCVYTLLKGLLRLDPRPERRELLRANLKSLVILLLILEFVITFVFGLLTTPMEKKRLMYFSEYKRAAQSELLQSIGKKEARFVFTDLYLPNSSRVIKKEEYTYTHTYNALGTRGPLPPLQKDSNEFRIVLLGDSFAEGEGAPDDSTIAVRLAHYLNSRQTGRTFSVINAGIAGSSPVYEQTLYRRHIKAYQPDLVIQTFYANDLFDINVMLHSDRLPLMEYFWATSHIYRVAYLLFINPDYVQYGYSEKTPEENRRFLQSYLLDLTDHFRAELSAQNTGLFTVYIPATEELNDNGLELAAQPGVMAWSKQNDLYLNTELPSYFTPRLSLEDNIEHFYWHYDAHMKPRGYDLVARILAMKISGTRLPAPPTSGPAPAGNAHPPSF